MLNLSLNHQHKDKYAALADLRRAAPLFQQQGNTERYQNILKVIEEIEPSL